MSLNNKKETGKSDALRNTIKLNAIVLVMVFAAIVVCAYHLLFDKR